MSASQMEDVKDVNKLQPLSQLLILRHLVGYLGEKAQFGWWPTAFFDSSSRLFLEPVFAKTATLAQYHGVVEAARRYHDEHLSVGSYHLFRLPEETEQDLHDIMQIGSNESIPVEAIKDKQAALDALGGFCANRTQEAVGPISIGRVQDLRTPVMIASIAKIYHTAFLSQKQAFPYFTS